MAATRERAIVEDRVCENIELAKLAAKIVSWEIYAPYCGLSPTDEMKIKEDSEHYVVQKLRMLERWKERSGEDATYRNLTGIFERVGDQVLANFVYKLAQDQGRTKSHDRSLIIGRKLMMCFFVVFVTVIICCSPLVFRQQSVKHSMIKYRPTQCTLYAGKVKHRYKNHLPDVAQSFWLPADMHTFIQLSLTNRDNPRAPRVDQNSANERIVSERSMSFDDLLSEVDASPGSRILVVGQPGIGKTTLLQMITRSWAHDRALSSCWILLHIVLRDLVLLQHAPNLTTFLSFMGTIWLPPDIETFVLESDGKGLCFIVDGLDEYPAGYEDNTNFIYSELIGAQKPNIKLAQSTVVISSRPEVASHVWHLFDKRVEVLGFGDDQINEYVQAKYGEDKSFSKYLDDHPIIKHTCYIPLHLAMLVYLKDSLLDNLPETETVIYEQFIIQTLIRDFCKNPTVSCSSKNTFPSSLNHVDELNSPEIVSLLFHIANLSYNGVHKRQSIFTEVSSVLQHTNSSYLVVDKMSVLQPTTYSFPHLTIQNFLAAFYFTTYLTRQEQKRVLVEYSNQSIRHVFWKFCCGLKRNENQTTFLEFFNLFYQYRSRLPYYCAHEAQSVITSQQLINFTKGIAKLKFLSYYDAASFAFVAVSAAQNLREINGYYYKYPQFLLHKLCDATTNYSQLRKVMLEEIDPTNVGCLLQKSPNLESLSVNGLNWDKLQSEDAAALVLPPNGTTLLNIRHIHLEHLNIGDKGVKKLSQLRNSISLETLSLKWNGISDDGASVIADLMKTLPRLQHVNLARNHIGGRGAALLWNQSIHKCCNLSLNFNIIGDDSPDPFINALNGTVNNGYERNESCQLEVSVLYNELLCSDLRDIRTISKKLPKGIQLNTRDSCFNMTEKILKRVEYHVSRNHGPPIKVVFQWILYVVCTIHIFLSTRTPLWGLLYFFGCLTIFILPSFNMVDYFNFVLSLLWSWIVVGRLIFCVSLKLLSKPWGWVLITIIAVLVQLYFIHLTFFDYAFIYIFLILGYVLFHLGLFSLYYLLFYVLW